MLSPDTDSCSSDCFSMDFPQAIELDLTSTSSPQPKTVQVIQMHADSSLVGVSSSNVDVMWEASGSSQIKFEEDSDREGDFPGKFNFGFHLQTSKNDWSKPSWQYSMEMNHLFIEMDKVVSVNFIYDNLKAINVLNVGLGVRAYLRFKDNAHEPVVRCAVHSFQADPECKSHQDGVCRCRDYSNVGHVVRCISQKAVYCFDGQTKVHSVLLPAPICGDVLYYFTCKSSCPKGINRRPVKLVFSLEDFMGFVHGRCSLDVKVCCSPKRDKLKFDKRLVKSNPKPPVLEPLHLTVKQSLGSMRSILDQVSKLLVVLNEKLSELEAAIDSNTD